MDNKVFTWNEMWQFINILVDNSDKDISVMFTEKGEDGKLINLPEAQKFVNKINKLKNGQ